MNGCMCGHQPADHYGETGGCEAFDPDKDNPCPCPRYEHEGDM